MKSLTGAILLLSLIVFSLIVVSFCNRVQTRNQLIRQKVQHMRFRIDELEEICASIEPLLESVLIPKLINEEILDLIQSVKQLDPKATFVDLKLEHARALAEKLELEQRTQPYYRVMASDTAIAKHKQYLTDAARVVRRHHFLGRIQNDEMESYVRELSWAHLMVEVISHVVQGHKAVNRSDPVVAYGYYRRAQNVLIGALQADERRHRMIRELSEILNGKRLALSTDLMPETEFNPTQKPNFSGISGADLNQLDQLDPPDGEYKAS